MVKWILFLLTGLTLSAQPFNPAFLAGLERVKTGSAQLSHPDVAGLYVDLNPATLDYSVGASVSNITDSVSGLVWGQLADENMPAWTNNASSLNEKPFLQFDAVSDLLTNYGARISYPSTVYFLAKFSRVDAASRSGFSSRGANFGLFLTSGNSLRWDAGTALDSSGNHYFKTNWILYEVSWTNNTQSAVYTNGVLLMAGNAGATAITNIMLNSTPGGSWYGGLQLGRFLVWTNNPADSDRSLIRAWFKNEYGVPVQ